eukprot:c11114_g1_i1.p1 GENE.c11114_g1_i1~~c11114_g1_i1.p1  ORF type:complete len:337 (+),score=69.05 c11114_g1_i1:43-1053(+)
MLLVLLLALVWSWKAWVLLGVLLVLFLLMDCDMGLFILERITRVVPFLRPNFSGRTVWITGASSGIGEYLAYELAKCGATLILSARQVPELERVKKNCVRPDTHLVVPLDLADHDSHQKVVEGVLKVKSFDTLIHNAGRSQRSLIEHTSLLVDKAQLDLNFLGTVSLTKAVLPHLRSNPSRSKMISVVTSLAGKLPSPASASYSASKHAMHGYYSEARLEFRPDKINVSILAPGPVVSLGGLRAMSGTTDKTAQEDGIPPSAYDKRRMPTQRFARLAVIALYYNIPEAWISGHPELLFTYIYQYSPTLGGLLANIFGASRVEKFRREYEQSRQNLK